MSEGYSFDRYVDDLRQIARETDDEDEILSRVGPLARRVALQKDWLRQEHHEVDEEQGFGVHLLHEEPDHTLAVFAVAWAPGQGTPPHDHGTWAVVCGVEGKERNIRYKRLDDGRCPGYAELEIKHEFAAEEGELVCMKTGGIHLVRNESDEVTISLHTYGKHVNYTDRSQFDPEANTAQTFKVTVD